MIKHIVMFKLIDTANGKTKSENALEAKERFQKVIDNVPSIITAELVINSEETPDSNYTVALICEFENIDALNEYQVHPEHVKFGEFITSVRESRACIDYEF